MFIKSSSSFCGLPGSSSIFLFPIIIFILYLKNYEEIKNKLLMLLFIFVDSFSYPKNKGSKNETANTASKLLKRNNKLILLAPTKFCAIPLIA